MRKNFLLVMIAAVTMLFATSCQKEELGTEVTVSFALSQPGIATKTYSDGKTARNLTYAVYEAGTQNLVTSEELVNKFDGNSLSTTVNLRLLTGHRYDIVFWADAETSPYTFTPDNQEITVNYADALSQDENRDAFFAVVDDLEIDGAISQPVTLKRPFAQLNIGTTDMTEAAVIAMAPTQSSVTVENVYTNLNLVTGEVSNETAVTYVMAAFPDATTESFPNVGSTDPITYLSMNYLLVSADNDLVDIKFTVANANNTKTVTREFTSVPVQRNYRTNIYGKLLTNPADFNITIDPDYDNPNINQEVWDGVTVTQPASTATEWIVSSAAEWVYLKQNGVQSKNIKLDANIDFGGYEVKGLAFTGIFDGQGHTMSNMTLLCGGSYYSNGLFQGDASNNVTVQNVTIANVTAECANPDQGYVGTIFGDVQNNSTVTLNGVNIENANLCGVQSVGGLVGFVTSGATLNVENCTVDGSTISNYDVDNESGSVAGLVGRPVGTVNVTNSTVTNTTIDAYYAARRGAVSIQPVVGNDATLTAGADVVVIKKIGDGAEVNGVHYGSLTNALAAAVDNDVVILSHGTHVIPVAQDKILTFQGTGDATKTIIDCSTGNQDLKGSTVTFENLTIKTNNGNYQGFQHITNATYNNCIIKNQYTLYGSSTFTGCTFEVEGNMYNTWTYGAAATFTGCTFNCDGKAVLVYNENENTNDVVTFTNCTFNDNGGLNATKAAIEAAANQATVQHTININTCTVNGFAVTSQEATTHGGTNLGTNVWGNKNLMTADKLNVFIDGTEVY